MPYNRNEVTTNKLLKRLAAKKRSAAACSDQNTKLINEAQALFDEAMPLVKSNDYALALTKLLQSAHIAAEAKANEVGIKIRRYIVKYALLNDDYATALLQSNNLKDLVEMPDFVLNANLILQNTLNSMLKADDVKEVFFLLALTGFYQGEFAQCIEYFNKLGFEQEAIKKRGWAKKLGEITAALSVIKPYGAKIKKKDRKEDLENISIILQMLQHEGVQCIENIDSESLVEVLSNLKILIAAYNVEQCFKAEDKDNEYKLCYLGFEQQEAEIYLCWGSAIIKFLEKNKVTAEIFVAYQQYAHAFLINALAYAQRMNNFLLIYSATDYLARYSELTPKQNGENNEKYQRYIKLRDYAASKLINKMPSNLPEVKAEEHQAVKVCRPG